MAGLKIIWAPASVALGVASLSWFSVTGSLSNVRAVHLILSVAGIVSGLIAWRLKSLRALAVVGIVISSLLPTVLLLSLIVLSSIFVSH